IEFRLPEEAGKMKNAPNNLMENKMTIRGQVRNGVVVLDNGGKLPEGSKVSVRVLGKRKPIKERRSKPKVVPSGLMKHAGKVADLPTDAARNLDHYLYGHPKQ